MFTNLTKLNELGMRFRNQHQAVIRQNVDFLEKRIDKLATISPMSEDIRELCQDFERLQRLANEFALGSNREFSAWALEFSYLSRKMKFTIDKVFFELGKKGGDER